MDRDQYWTLVEATRPPNNDPEAHCTALTQRLQRMPLAEIADFYHNFRDFVGEADRADIWSVVYEINGGCSDDGFAYFRSWLVMQGQAVLETTLLDPESLAEIAAGTEVPHYESYWSVASDAYQAATGEDVPNEFFSLRREPKKPPTPFGRFIRNKQYFRRKFPMLSRLMKDPPSIDPIWLRWNDATVKWMAEAIHKDRRWKDLSILADALEEAGCSEPFVLDHLRAGRRHARSCWVTYLLLR